MLVHIVEYGLATIVIPITVCWLVLRSGPILGALGRFGPRLARRLGLAAEPVPEPADPPLDRVADNLRRIARSADQAEGMTRVRRQGLQMAHDDLLVTACRQLDVPNALADTPAGWGRDVERLRVEAALRAAGLVIRETPCRGER